MTDFSKLPIRDELLSNLASLGYKTTTPVQEAALPAALKGHDLIVQAQTGSGKTAAFSLPILNNLKPEQFRVQALVLCPTRELADQVAKEARRLSRRLHNIKILTLCGGQPFGPQINSLSHGAHIIVGTPGRIEEHLRKNHLSLSNVNTLVLDEADRMLEMGFKDTLDHIIERLPQKRQALLFSATFPKDIEAISERIAKNAERITIAAEPKQVNIDQHLYTLKGQSRADATAQLLKTFQPHNAMVFCNTKKETAELAEQLNDQGIVAVALHGDLDQKSRDQTLTLFANESARVLTATDVAARGIDIPALAWVINYQLPRDPEVYVHRIGRTGRAGESGHTSTLIEPKEHYKLERLQSLLEVPEPEPLPEASSLDEDFPPPAKQTLQIDGGKKSKLRPGDILGALTNDKRIQGSQIGKIHIFDFCAYVAVEPEISKLALDKLNGGKLKGKTFRARRIKPGKQSNPNPHLPYGRGRPSGARR